MQQPWLKYFTRDHLDHKELRRCSHLARSIWADLICLMAEGTPRGYLADKVGTLDMEYVAARINASVEEVKAAIEELALKKVAEITPDGLLYSPKMVRDEEIRLKRASGGIKSLDNPKVAQPRGIVPIAPAEAKKLEIKENALEIQINHAADRIYENHPPARRCGIAEIQKRLRAIVKGVPAADRIKVLQYIYTQHERWCQSEEWTKDDGMYAKGLDNWLAPTMRRWENDPPAPVQAGMGFGRVAI